MIWIREELSGEISEQVHSLLQSGKKRDIIDIALFVWSAICGAESQLRNCSVSADAAIETAASGDEEPFPIDEAMIQVQSRQYL